MISTNRPPSGKRFRFFFIVLLATLAMSCNDSDKESAVFNDPMTSEVLTKEALALSWDLLQIGQSMADAGNSIQEILNILPDSTLVQTNGKAILYFIEGSFPMMIEMPIEVSRKGMTKGNAIRTKSTGLKTLASTPLLESSSLADEDEVDIVAREKGEEERQDKKALVLAPYPGDFGNSDDGLVAREYLEKNKNYQGRVQFESANLSLEKYKSFAEYDLVHLSTHGENFCGKSLIKIEGEIELFNDTNGSDSSAPEVLFEDAENSNSELSQSEITDSEGNEITNYDDTTFYGYGCRTIIKTGIKHDVENMSSQEVVEYLLSLINDKHLIVITDSSIGLKSSFFDFYYGQLQDKIWVFSACELGQLGDLATTMNNIHENGHFFYWLNTVYAEHARPVFKNFYENLVEEGLDAEKAFERIPENLRSGLDSEMVIYSNGVLDTVEATTSLLHLKTGDPRHGIEVIEMYHLEENDQRVRPGDFYPIVGDFGDGEDEALTLKVQLKGYTRAEFEDKEMSIGLKVDDEIVLWKKAFLPDNNDDEIEVEDLEDQEFGVEVTISDIPIPDVGEKRFLELDAYLHFDDERFSIHSERVSIKPTGILATIIGDGQHLILTYNEETEAMKIQSANTSRTQYMDRDGWLYMEDNQTGWMKMNLSGIMGMSMGGIMGSNMDMSGLQELVDQDLLPEDIKEEATSNTTFGETYQTGGNANFFLPMIEWGMRFKTKDFERNSDFKSGVVDCGKPQPCKKFMGIQGQANGVEATFNPGGQIIRIKYQGKTITYDYGDYTVNLPEAREFKIPFFDN